MSNSDAFALTEVRGGRGIDSIRCWELEYYYTAPDLFLNTSVAYFLVKVYQIVQRTVVLS